MAICSHLLYRGYSVDAGALKIDRLRPEDAGTYICNAQNDVGKNEHTTNLLVGGKAMHTAVCCLLCTNAFRASDLVTVIEGNNQRKPNTICDLLYSDGSYSIF